MPFQKGYNPWNKGLKKENHPSIKKIGFKKGNIPWNKNKKGIMPIPWNKGKIGCFEGYWKNKKRPPFSKEWRNKMSQSRKGKKGSNWKGGKFKNKKGYVFIHKPNHPFCEHHGYVREHRLIIEKQIGRYLQSNEVTHHLGRKDDNRPQMLMAFINNSAHIKFERGIKINPSQIIFDGRNFK